MPPVISNNNPKLFLKNIEVIIIKINKLILIISFPKSSYNNSTIKLLLFTFTSNKFEILVVIDYTYTGKAAIDKTR